LNNSIEDNEGKGPTMAQIGLSQQELESRLWAAANSLRGPVDPSDFKAYIFPLLFYKRINDSWDAERERAIADFEDDLTDEIEADYHRFAIPSGCRWVDLRRVAENVGVALQNILDRIQQANPETLAGIFGDVPCGTMNLSPEAVGHDVLGNAYEYLLKQFADESGKKAGEFFTPRTVVRLLTRILEPKPTDSIYDPACGSGGMLVEAANEVIEAGGSLKQMRFYGQEVNLTTAAIARMNLFLHDIEDAKIIRGDTLRQPRFLDDKGRLQRFMVVMANPPFSLKGWGADTWNSDPWSRAECGVPPAGNADFAWVQHMVASMDPSGGRLGVVMPHGVLFRGSAEGKIRQCLIENDQLETIIGLPANLFYSTSIPACLLIFRTKKELSRRGIVLFIDGSLRFSKGKNQNVMDDSDADAILATYQSGEENSDVKVFARLVEHAEIKENGWDLNIGRYLKSDASETVDIATALSSLASAQVALGAAEATLAERLKAAGYA
jgi:type I restriction enzyme M protein